MATEPLVKRPLEERLYRVNFAPQPELRDNGETLSGVPAVSSTPAGLTIASPLISGTYVTFTASGGTDETDYVIRIVVNTSGGATLEETVPLQVREGP